MLSSHGQMSVELAVVFSVALALVYVMVNTMLFISACARFDRLSSEAVRTMATSPSSDSYAQTARAFSVKQCLESNFTGEYNVEISVDIKEVPIGHIDEMVDLNGSAPVVFSLLPKQEEFTCIMTFHPWGLPLSVFGIELPKASHERSYVVDVYRPGVIF